ncbi:MULTISPECIES: alpha/beta hydrolase [unclassified Mesorhizobium]|uniref:alpha/beta fold hydrolase n=1 Tax=unclassified Mesorhizobium TaxID=325217 RepID=UPI000FCA21A0|nr:MULTISPECIES: alpha/beta hydrolase [unclassified Mesorhizobium]RUZ86395.1 alpha/beta hydrolase [Mesorhizobium sp. M7A.F.Ca.US.003.02.2.1]RUX77222.1 alpha/beta hydrolase [Mesorhizobium sp. M7A.F.Ca.US.005.03.1.1]RUY16571.1 alpha/beta hydrolase [Mesorhizobium sp. M7A.F.Ca.US.005.03.2.1]RUY27712.1 alpha/beta hydrolase [Mesorhizobium sp. M7A.F.Ca.US.001.04.2.1]RUY39531.1 alpha/beta hydrolase [Mesorhizobium sp. M7A.F.Ca.US.001.04.1.1]
MLVQTLEAGDMQLAVSTAGDPRRPALILLHGWPHSRKIYDGVIDELGTRYFTLAFDLPEIGESRGTPPSAEKKVLAGIVISAAEALGAKSIVVAGFDVGGMIAFAAARHHGGRIVGAVPMNTVIPGLQPWTKVVANPGIWHFAFHAVPELPELLVTGHQRAYFDFFFDLLAGRPEALTNEMRETLTQAYARPEALKAGFDWYRAFKQDAEANAPARIEVPILYIRGDADFGSIDDYLEGLRMSGAKNLQGHMIANCGEFLPIEAPAEFVKALVEFAPR